MAFARRALVRHRQNFSIGPSPPGGPSQPSSPAHLLLACKEVDPHNPTRWSGCADPGDNAGNGKEVMPRREGFLEGGTVLAWPVRPLTSTDALPVTS